MKLFRLVKPIITRLLSINRPLFDCTLLTRKFSPSIFQLSLQQKCWFGCTVANLKKSTKDGRNKELPPIQINEEEDDEKNYQELVSKIHLLPRSGHQVFVIQPYIKFGPNKNYDTTPDLMIEEAIALVDCLGWVCVQSVKVPLVTLEKKQLFGSGNFENLANQIRSNQKVSAVFVSTNILRGLQKRYS